MSFTVVQDMYDPLEKSSAIYQLKDRGINVPLVRLLAGTECFYIYTVVISFIYEIYVF